MTYHRQRPTFSTMTLRLFGPCALLLALYFTACGTTDGPTSAGGGDAKAIAADGQIDGGAGDDAGAQPALTTDGIASVTPNQGTAAGGVAVEIKGRGFDRMTSVWFGESKALNVQLIDDTTLRVVTPPRPAGIVDVIVVRFDPIRQKSDELRSVAAYRAFASVRVDSIDPTAGPRFGGVVATITGAGFGPDTRFIFGRRMVVDYVILDEFTATVITPPGTPGVVDVSAANSDGAATLRDAYTYKNTQEKQAPGITVLPVKPDIFDAAGGSPFEVRWNGPAGLKLIGIRVGGLMAAKLAVSKTSAMAVAPKGSPGPTDVTLIFQTGVATLVDAVLYTVNKPFVAALLPGRGAQSGGTVVDVVGGGLHRLTTLRFGDKVGVIDETVHTGLVRVISPRGDPGTVHVRANFSGAEPQTLFNAWAWFDPQQASWGTWGGAIRGALNVTVRRANYPGGIVQGAMVVIGEEPVPALSGMTDDRGQVTLSAPDLRGPLSVHASAPGFGAGSVVVFNARHVTILIRKHPTPPTNGGPQGPTTVDYFEKGTIVGRVRFVNKLLRLPMGSCDPAPASTKSSVQGATLPSKDGQCAPCTATCSGKLNCSGLLDAVGGLSLAASATTTNQRYCLRSCLSSADCDLGWDCRAVGTPGSATWTTQCVPEIGRAQTRCETSSFSQFSISPDPGALATAKADGSFAIQTRLGEMAVICRAGYVSAGTTDFVPLVMGVARGVKVPDDKNPVNTEVWLDTPLTRVVHFALESLPKDPSTAAHRRFVQAWLDLDGEGFLKLGTTQTYALTDRMDLQRMPSRLRGSLKGLNWTVFAGMQFDNDDDGAPSSLAMNRDVRIESGDQVASWRDGATAPSAAEAWSPPVVALSSGAAGLFAVGESGVILRWSGNAFTAQQSPTNRTLRAVWLDAASADGWIGGDDGVLLRRDGLLGWQVAASPTTARILTLSGGANGPWMLDAKGGIWRFDGKVWRAITGPTTTTGAAIPGLRALAAQQSNPGQTATGHGLWLVGDGGAVYAGTHSGNIQSGGGPNTGKSGAWTWTKIAGSAANTTWLAVLPDGKDVWLAGDSGRLALVTGGALTMIDSGTTQPLRQLTLRPGGGAFVVGGAATWLELKKGSPPLKRSISGLEVDLRGIARMGDTWVAAGQPTIRIKPFLAMPAITTPKVNTPVGSKIAWTTKPGPSAEMHRIEISTFWRQSYWQIYAPGNVTEVALPNFGQLGGWQPLPGGPLRVRVWRAFGPTLDVNRFTYNEMSPWYWQSWSYNWSPARR